MADDDLDAKFDQPRLAACLFATLPLEFALHTRVYAQWLRLLSTLVPVVVVAAPAPDPAVGAVCDFTLAPPALPVTVRLKLLPVRLEAKRPFFSGLLAAVDV